MKGTGTYIVAIVAAPPPKPDKSATPLRKDLIVPYWLVRTTSDKDKANVKYGTLKSTTAIGIGNEEWAEEAITIPVLVNSKVLDEGDELLVSKEESKTKAESLAPAPKPEAAPPGSKRVRPTAVKRLYQPLKKARKC